MLNNDDLLIDVSEVAEFIFQASGQILDAFENKDDFSKSNVLDSLELKVKQAEFRQDERNNELKLNYEKEKGSLRKKWKRY